MARNSARYPRRVRAANGVRELGVSSQHVGSGHLGRRYPTIRRRFALRSVPPGPACDEDRSARYPSNRLNGAPDRYRDHHSGDRRRGLQPSGSLAIAHMTLRHERYNFSYRSCKCLAHPVICVGSLRRARFRFQRQSAACCANEAIASLPPYCPARTHHCPTRTVLSYPGILSMRVAQESASSGPNFCWNVDRAVVAPQSTQGDLVRV